MLKQAAGKGEDVGERSGRRKGSNEEGKTEELLVREGGLATEAKGRPMGEGRT